ncbi:MAG: hypothetical protein ABI680_04935 [Chthoniobacteraceae bacterium]
MFSASTSKRVLGAAIIFLGGIAIGYVLAPPGGAETAKHGGYASTPVPDPIEPGEPADDRAARPRMERASSSPDEGAVIGDIRAAAQSHDYFRRRHDLYELGERLDPAGLANAMTAAEQFTSPDRDMVQPALLSAWLRKDADGAMAWVRAIPPGDHRFYLLSEAFSGLGRMDPPSALRFMAEESAFQSKAERSRCLHEIFHGWGEADPAAAAVAVAALPDADDRENAMEPLLGHWANRDPRGALEWASQRGTEQERKSARDSVLRQWAETDPRSASQYVTSLPPGPERLKSIQKVFRSVAEWDFDTALRLTEGIDNVGTRNQLLKNLIDNSSGTARQRAQILEAMPAVDDAYRYARVARDFAEEDRDAALQWAGNVSGAEAQKQALSGVLLQWAEDEPRQALDYAMNGPGSNPGMINGVFNTWADHDPQAAFAWATALPAGDLRQASMITAITKIGSSDPLGAIETAKRTLRTTDEQHDAISSIAHQWMSRDLPAVVAWMARQPDAIQGELTSAVATEWTREDPVGAAAWLDGLPPGTRRDTAVATFVNAVSRSDPAGAATWAATISDATQRRYAIQNVYSTWAQADRDAANAWLRSTNAVTPAERAEFIRTDDSDR